jgi:hypothetical protein
LHWSPTQGPPLVPLAPDEPEEPKPLLPLLPLEPAPLLPLLPNVLSLDEPHASVRSATTDPSTTDELTNVETRVRDESIRDLRESPSIWNSTGWMAAHHVFRVSR